MIEAGAAGRGGTPDEDGTVGARLMGLEGISFGDAISAAGNDLRAQSR